MVIFHRCANLPSKAAVNLPSLLLWIFQRAWTRHGQRKYSYNRPTLRIYWNSRSVIPLTRLQVMFLNIHRNFLHHAGIFGLFLKLRLNQIPPTRGSLHCIRLVVPILQSLF